MTDTPPAEDLLDERLEIETPERVKIVYDLAGIGSRFAAGTIDVFLVAVLWVILGLVVVVAAGLSLPTSEEAQFAFGTAVVGVFMAVLAAYYLAFEWMWSGQTPGKRMLQLRVLSDTGGPASAGAIFVRNVLRVADILPGIAPYGLGGIVMFVNRRGKRIGDYAAGTMVVRERDQPLGVLPSPPADAMPGDVLDSADLLRIRSFLLRSPQLLRERRVTLEAQLAADVAARYGLVVVDANHLLRLLASGRSPRQIRETQGPRL